MHTRTSTNAHQRDERSSPGQAFQSPSWFLLLTASTGTTPTWHSSFSRLGLDPAAANHPAGKCCHYSVDTHGSPHGPWYHFSSRTKCPPYPSLCFGSFSPSVAWCQHDPCPTTELTPGTVVQNLCSMGRLKEAAIDSWQRSRGLEPDSAPALPRCRWTQWELIRKMTG